MPQFINPDEPIGCQFLLFKRVTELDQHFVPRLSPSSHPPTVPQPQCGLIRSQTTPDCLFIFLFPLPGSIRPLWQISRLYCPSSLPLLLFSLYLMAAPLPALSLICVYLASISFLRPTQYTAPSWRNMPGAYSMCLCFHVRLSSLQMVQWSDGPVSGPFVSSPPPRPSLPRSRLDAETDAQ